MKDFFTRLFSSDGFMPHGHCYLWNPGVLWLHIASDAFIALAYYSIPFTLVYFIRKRQDIPFNWMFLCFAIFIVACGTTHLMEIWVIWHPTYWLSGTIKAITALVSVPTAILLVRLLPQAITLPSPAALRDANANLEQEIAERKRAEANARQLNDELERRVAERTRELERTNANFRESQKLLQAIIDNSPAVIYVKDLHGRYLLANRRFGELFHAPRDSVVGKTDYDFFQPAAADAFRAMDERVAASGQALTEEESVPQDDGPHTYISVKSPLRDDTGKPCAVFGISTDITEQKRADEKVKWLASFPEENPNPILELDFAAGTIHYQNPAATRLFPDLPGRGLEHPFLAGLPGFVQKLRAGGTATMRREIGFPGNYFTQTISYIPETRRLRVYGTDITARKDAEDQLKISLKEVNDLKAALDEHAIVAVTDPHGRITYVNDKFCSISKYSREELIGQDHRVVNSGHHSKEFIRDLWTTIAHGKVWHGEIKNRAKDGTFYWVDTTIVPFLNENGKPRQYVAIRADVTERKRAEDQINQLNAELEHRVVKRTAELEAANKELEAFSYSVSHDLRAPLRAINGYAGIALVEYGSHLPEDGRRCLERMRNGGMRMGELIDDLLAFSRLGRTPLEFESVDMTRLVAEVLDELSPTFNDRPIEFTSGKIPACQGDAGLLKQVWANLLSNAIKYSRGRNPARVEIGCTENNGQTVYFVRDNGAGFDMKYANKLFGVFQRLHRADEFEGTGVGLAIVHRIVSRHGGRVWAEAGLNRGATFYFTVEGEKL